eukprot:c12248_g1_i2.p2 GENE.c12248_g1_i2~~c12248_g1_i2.p2  ORF type:complete len:439 (+),score=100.78 c12248_g1_i2:1-1317(+)
MGLALFIVLLFIFALVVLLVLLYTNATVSNNAYEARTLARRRTSPYSFVIIIVALQTLGLLGNLNVSWPSAVRRALNGLNFANMDMNLFSSECSLSSFSVKYIFSLLFPLFFMGICLGIVAVYWLARRAFSFCSDFPDIGVAAMASRIAIVIAPLLYIPQARAALTIFDCTKLPNKEYVLDADLAVRCFTRQWWLLAAIAGVVVVVFVIGIPAYFVRVLFKSRTQLFLPQNLREYGSLYKLYRQRLYFFEVAQLGRKLVIVFTSLFFSQSIVFCIAILLLTFGASALIITVWRPYYHTVYNQLEQRLALCLCVLLFFGFAFYANVWPSVAARNAFLVFALALIVFMLLVMLYTMGREIYQLVATPVGSDDALRLRSLAMFVVDESPDWPDPAMGARIHELAFGKGERPEKDPRRNSARGSVDLNALGTEINMASLADR